VTIVYLPYVDSVRAVSDTAIAFVPLPCDVATRGSSAS